MGTLKLKSFQTAYENTFKVIRCDSNFEKGKALRLRHQVFCKEYGYECPTVENSYMEEDIYDSQAVHHVLCHRISNEVAGTLRVVFPNTENLKQSFPIQKYCDHPFLNQEERIAKLCEISRFCMASRFRKRQNDGRFLSSYHDQDVVKGKVNGRVTFIRRQIAYAPAGLLRGAFETAIMANVLDCVWMVEPAHMASLRKIGFPYRALGPQVKMHGGLQPIVFNIKHVLDTMRRETPACWEIISDQGRLHDLADEVHQNDWHDSLLDEQCLDDIYNKIAAE